MNADAQVPETLIRVLLLEDNPDDARLIRRALAGSAARHLRLARVEERLAAVLAAAPLAQVDVILTDLDLPDSSGLETVSALRRAAPLVPIVVLTGQADEALGVAALREGAQDYLVKDHAAPALLARTLRHAVERKRLHMELAATRDELEERVRARTAELEQANRALAQTEERYRRLIETSPVATIVHQQGSIAFANSAALELFGAAEPRELLGRRMLELTDPAFHAVVRERMRRTLEERVPAAPMEQRYLRLDGTPVEVEVRAAPFELGGESASLVVVRDISERKAQERRIARLNRIQVMLSAINAAIVRIRDRQGVLEEACRIAVELGGLSMAWIATREAGGEAFRLVAKAGFEAEGLADMRLTTRADAPAAQGVAGPAIRELRTMVDNDITARPDVGYFRAKAIDRGFRSSIALPLVVEEKVAGVFVMYAEVPGFFTAGEIKLFEEIASDVAFALDYIAKAERADYLAYYDPLTGLPNRTLFHDHLGQQLRTRGAEQAVVAVLMLNLERFRSINETLGRKAGDKLLRKVAARLKQAMEGRELPARIGADSFALVMRGASQAADLARAVETLVEACFATPFEINEDELRISARVGIALFPSDGRDAEHLFRNAEAALAKAKSGGERIEFYAPEINARVAEALALENKLRRALERDELVLHYQPKYSAAQGTVTGVEALMRWQDPREGLVPPGRFIPLLEETGLILDAGRWALRRALADRRSWAAKGLRAPRVAVNVSPLQLQRRDFVAEVRAAIEAAGADGQSLELEITESQVMRELEANMEKLRALRAMGVEIAVDDFGTGYSSLSYIARLPVSSLKIDRSFIVQMTGGPDGLAIVSTIIGLAHSLGHRVVAEGVESDEQARLLRLMRCDEMQGYLFCRPVPAEAIEALLAAAAG